MRISFADPIPSQSVPRPHWRELLPTANQDRKAFVERAFAYDGDECLLWPFATAKKGYPLFCMTVKNFLVSRIVCEEAHGPPSTAKHMALHSCDNPPCITKRHLRWGTHRDNMDDMHARGRASQPKLTSAVIVEIRSLIGTMTQKTLAKRFGVSHSAIRKVERLQQCV